jgi:hypothetical protein
VVYGFYNTPYRDKKVVGVFVRFRAPLQPEGIEDISLLILELGGIYDCPLSCLKPSSENTLDWT